MKKFLTVSMFVASMAFAIPSVQAKADNVSGLKANNASAVQTYRVRPNGRVVRVETRTRIVRVGGQTFRETYQVRYLPNGNTQTRLLNRVLVRSNQGWNNRVAGSSYQTRFVNVGGQRFREIYLVRRYPNGRTQTRLVSRTRVR